MSKAPPVLDRKLIAGLRTAGLDEGEGRDHATDNALVALGLCRRAPEDRLVPTLKGYAILGRIPEGRRR